MENYLTQMIGHSCYGNIFTLTTAKYQAPISFRNLRRISSQNLDNLSSAQHFGFPYALNNFFFYMYIDSSYWVPQKSCCHNSEGYAALLPRSHLCQLLDDPNTKRIFLVVSYLDYA